MKNCILLCFIILTHHLTFSQYTQTELLAFIQKSSEEDLLLESSRLLAEGYYSDADYIVTELLTKQPDNANYNYRKGYLLSEGKSSYSAAIPFLEKATQHVVKNYDMFSVKEQNASEESFYYLAKCYHRTGQLKKAEEYYQIFLDKADKTQLEDQTKIAIQQLNVADKAIKYPKKNVTIVNLGDQINTNSPEYSPIVSFDGSTLYFTSRREWGEKQDINMKDGRLGYYPEDVYVSYKQLDKTWSSPTRLEFCTPDQNEASVSVSTSERRVYVYQDVLGGGDVYFSDFNQSRFKEIESLTTAEVNSKYWETHCFVTPDGNNMYFTSERPGGYGGRDIYRVAKLPDGNWGEPYNLGPKINSSYDEDSPFMSVDNKSLYFSSNGPASMGGFDIMVTFIDENNNWSDPVNMGYPFNSTDDDLFYTETMDGRTGYITSKRPDSKGDKDIYEIQTDYLSSERGTLLKGKIITLNDLKLPEDVTLTLVCTNCDASKQPITVYPRQADGSFMINLDPCNTYDMVYSYENGAKEFWKDTLSTDCYKRSEELYREAYLDAERMVMVPKVDTTTTPIESVVVTDFKNLDFKHLFSYNANKLSVSRGELKDFVKEIEQQLKDGREHITINIYSSASNVPTKTYKTNEELTTVRAENMKYDLISYFESKTEYKEKVNVVIISAVVDGPEYINDSKRAKKYQPFQFVALKTE